MKEIFKFQNHKSYGFRLHRNDNEDTAVPCPYPNYIKSVGIGIIHLSLPFLCTLCVLCGLIIPIQPELILIVGTRHCRVLTVGNNNSDGTGVDIRTISGNPESSEIYAVGLTQWIEQSTHKLMGALLIHINSGSYAGMISCPID